MSGPFRAGIVGLGGVAAGYDRPDSPATRTHIKACLNDLRFELVAVSDLDLDRAADVRSEWSLSAEVVPVAEFFDVDLDVICVSTPTETHLEMLRAAVARPPRILLCEKPLSRDPVAAEEAVATLTERGCTVAVNYLRRCIPGLNAWLDNAHAGVFGRPLGATASYSGGFWRNGSHAFDVIAEAFGERELRVLFSSGSAHGLDGDDPAVTALFTLDGRAGSVPVWLRGVDGGVLTIFDLDVLFERARLRLQDVDGGTEARFDSRAPVMDGAFPPELRSESTFGDSPPRLMARVWANLADHLEGGAALASTADDALAALRLQASVADACA